MRFVWAVVALVLATVMIGAGIAQRTILQGPRSVSQAIEIDREAPFILIDGAVLDAHEGAQTLRAQGDGTVFAAYGRTTDLTAWLSRSDYVHVTAVPDGSCATILPDGDGYSRRFRLPDWVRTVPRHGVMGVINGRPKYSVRDNTRLAAMAWTLLCIQRASA